MKINLANWPVPKHVTALSTTRLSGYSDPPYDSNNLALHVGDDEAEVKKNRERLVQALNLPAEPIWLSQTHSTRCIIAEEDLDRKADAAITRSKKHPLVILTADCLPITLCSIRGDEIAAIHAGWRGLLNGIVENTLSKMHNKAEQVMAWIGPAICGRCYEVGEEMYLAFRSQYKETVPAFQVQHAKWLADLPKIAEVILKLNGISAIYSSHLCTFELQNELFSYRRQPQTGRIASLIWFNTTSQDSYI